MHFICSSVNQLQTLVRYLALGIGLFVCFLCVLFCSIKQHRKCHLTAVIGAALKCAPIMEWEFILASGRSSF